MKDESQEQGDRLMDQLKFSPTFMAWMSETHRLLAEAMQRMNAVLAGVESPAGRHLGTAYATELDRQFREGDGSGGMSFVTTTNDDTQGDVTTHASGDADSLNTSIVSDFTSSDLGDAEDDAGDVVVRAAWDKLGGATCCCPGGPASHNHPRVETGRIEGEGFGQLPDAGPGDSRTSAVEEHGNLWDDLDRQARIFEYETEAAKLAYAAYGASTGFKTFDGRSMPDWPDLGTRVQAAWCAAARRILEVGMRLERAGGNAGSHSAPGIPQPATPTHDPAESFETKYQRALEPLILELLRWIHPIAPPQRITAETLREAIIEVQALISERRDMMESRDEPRRWFTDTELAVGEPRHDGE